MRWDRRAHKFQCFKHLRNVGSWRGFSFACDILDCKQGPSQCQNWHIFSSQRNNWKGHNCNIEDEIFSMSDNDLRNPINLNFLFQRRVQNTCWDYLLKNTHTIIKKWPNTIHNCFIVVFANIESCLTRRKNVSHFNNHFNTWPSITIENLTI